MDVLQGYQNSDSETLVLEHGTAGFWGEGCFCSQAERLKPPLREMIQLEQPRSTQILQHVLHFQSVMLKHCVYPLGTEGKNY